MITNIKQFFIHSLYYYSIIFLVFYTTEAVVRRTDSEWWDYIKENTNISRNHLTSEIQLHLTPDGLPTPFPDSDWGIYWAGGQALSRFLLDNNTIVKNLSVLDLGSGCGASSICAIKSGAREAIANDFDPVALLASKLNAELNSVHLKYNEDYLVGKNISYDCVIVGDMFIYEDEISRELFDWLYELKKTGKTVLIGDSGSQWIKNHNIQQRVTLLESYKLPYPQRVPDSISVISDAFVWTINA